MNTVKSIPASPLFVTRTAPACLAAAVNQPAAKMLFSELWHEGELSVLFGAPQAGTSLLAMQVCHAITTGQPLDGFTTEIPAQKVLYFDFDASDRQFAGRYATYPLHENLVRVTMNPEHCEPRKFGDQLMEAIETAVKEHEAKVIVVDSLATLKYFVSDTFFLTRLRYLKNRMKLSVLVVAGAKKIKPGRPVTLAHLAVGQTTGRRSRQRFFAGYFKKTGRGPVHPSPERKRKRQGVP